MSTTPRPADPVTAARERLERLLPDVLRYDPVSMPAFDQRIDALIEAVRAEAGVSAAVEALADVRARRSTFATAEAFDSAMLEAAWNILADRSAGSGTRVEAGHCCEHAAGAHAPGMNPCLIDGCRCSRPTPPPAVDGTRWDKTKRCEAVVDGLPCHMPPEIHPKVVRNRPEYDHQFLPCHPATPPTPAPVDGTRCGECPHAAHTGDICDTDRPGFVTGCPCRTATPPTPAPAVDGTRCAECGGVKDDVFHVPCLVGGPFHYVKTCHPFTPPTPAPAVDGLAAFAAGFRARHEWPTPAPADRLRALEAALRDWVEEVGLHDACDPDEFCSLLGDLRKKEPAARALLGSDGEGSR